MLQNVSYQVISKQYSRFYNTLAILSQIALKFLQIVPEPQ